MHEMKNRRSIWCLLIVVCLVVAGISLFSLISVVNAPSGDESGGTLLPCVDGEENADYSCNDGDGYDAFDLPVAQSYLNTSLFTNSVTDPSAPSNYEGIIYRGVNLAGGECEDDPVEHLSSNGEYLPFDNAAELFLYKGMNTFRIPVVWEYLADKDGNFFVPARRYMLKLDATIKGLTDKNAFVIIDLHNYMRYNPSNVTLNVVNTNPGGSDVLDGFGGVDGIRSSVYKLWLNIAQRYPSPRVIYGLMNEPHDVRTNDLNSLISASFAGIREGERRTGVPFTNTHLVLVSGSNRDRLHTWFTAYDATGTTNAENAPNYRRFAKAAKFAIEIHHHFDVDFSGRYVSGDCMPTEQYAVELNTHWSRFKAWAITNEQAIFVSEFGAPDTATCRRNVALFLDQLALFKYVPAQKYGVIGWTSSSAGTPGCGQDNPVTSLAPGGRANLLMWNETLYERYIDEVARPIPPLSESRLAMIVNNQGTQTLRYQRGYVPFQWQGSVDIEAGEFEKIYSNNNFSTPTLAISRHYYVTNKSDPIVFGFTPPSPIRSIAYANVGDTNCLDIVNDSFSCPIIITGPASNPGEPRCKTVLPVANC